MRQKWRRIFVALAMAVFGTAALSMLRTDSNITSRTLAQTTVTPTPAPQAFDQAAAVAKLREQIKGKENEPAEKVFKNIQMMKTVPAGRLLAIMQMGYARSLGVNCTHCHTPDKWEAEDKPQKQIAREMAAMAGRINGELLKNVKNLRSASPTVNCTTCHRGEIKPALNLPQTTN
jgi:hypothetical protein